MYKFLFLLLLLSLSLFGKKLELLTGEFVRDGNITVAKGGVSVFGKGVFITAENAVFDSDKHHLELFGNVIVKRENKTEAVVDYLLFNVHSERSYVDNILIPGDFKDIWLSAGSGEHYETIYYLSNVVSSSCDKRSPDWTIRSSSGSHNSKSKWTHLYHPKFYAGRVPVFYLPYFGFSTDDRRRSGLLPPKIGNSNIEGNLFELPLYIAPYDSWDLEIWPQIRSKRGEGIGSRLRFVDSPTSKGEIFYGQFTDKSSYIEEHSLIDDGKHTGFRLNYRKNSLFWQNRDRLYVKLEDYSDVDFLRLESVSTRDSLDIDRMIANKVNYYYKDDENYLGVYGRYFKDILEPDRDDLLHIYPDIQGHKFTDTFLFDSLMYSLDFRVKNFTRESNTSAVSQRAIVPLSYGGSFFDDYVNFHISQTFDLYRINYRNRPDLMDSNYGERLNTYTRFRLFNNLTKELGESYHNLNFALSYTLPGSESENGIFDDDFVTFNKEQEGVEFDFSQYLFNKSYQNRFTHRVNQSYLKKESNSWELGDLEHEVRVKPKDYLTIKNTIQFSHIENLILSNYSYLTLNNTLGSVTFGYLRGNNRETRARDTDYYTFKLKADIDKRNEIIGRYEYDNLDKETRKLSLKYNYEKRCWGFTLSYSREVEPVALATGASSRINDIIFLQLKIDPLGEHQLQVYEDDK